MPSYKDKAKYNEYLRIFMKGRYKIRKEKALLKLGSVCAKCGSPDELQFDHKERKTKFRIIAKMWSYSDRLFWAEIAKCQLLCGECHHKKTCEEMGWTYRPKALRRNWKRDRREKRIRLGVLV